MYASSRARVSRVYHAPALVRIDPPRSIDEPDSKALPPTQHARALLGLLIAMVALAGATPADAFMSLIRQGRDSAEVPNADDAFGGFVCTGDFDGDGWEDLASAAPDESNGLINGAVHGLVIISYGGSRGISSEGAHVISVGDLGTEAARFGRAMVAADFDGDGDDDLAVGIPMLNSIGGDDRGAVWFYDGGPGGLQLAPYLQVALEDVENLPEDSANFGWALTAGDFNDDSFPDVCTSAIGQGGDTGTLYFLNGSNNGITTTGSYRLFPFTVGGSQALGGRFGWSLEAAQLNGVGGDDLVVGAPMTDVNGQNNSGRVYFYYSGATGISGGNGWYLDASNLPAANIPNGDAHLGWSLAAGHLYQTSGQEDVAVGAPQDDYGLQTDAGTVYLIEFDTQLTNYDSIRELRQNAGQGMTNAQPGDQFGYAVAVGKFDIGQYEDLAVGAPFEDLTEQFVLGEQLNTGICHVFYGKDTGPSTSNVDTIDMGTLNNFIEGGANLGKSLAFGSFDNSGRDNLAIGAPGADFDSYESGGTDINDAGQVHIFAPWRQPIGRPHRTSVSLDCDAFIVYGQRPFQRTRPASTTKTMTLLLACEAIADGDEDPDKIWTVPQWVATQVGGSQTPLITGEKLSFDGLMKTMMTVSGNDSAMMIGAILSGQGNQWDGWSGTSPAFADAMETRASQLGLSSAVSLTNAAGIDSGDHYVTALDWASLAYQTIQNDCVKNIVNTSPWEVDRELPDGLWDQLMPNDTELNEFTTTFFAGWVDDVKNQYDWAVGIKPGGTPGGWTTGISAGNPPGPGGMNAASSFGTRREDAPVEGVVPGCSTCLHGDLLELSGGYCSGGPNDLTPGPPPPPRPWGTLTTIPACPEGSGKSMAIALGDEQAAQPGRIIQIDLMRRTHIAPTVTMRQVITRDARVSIAPGETVNFGSAPHQQNFGIEIVNDGENTANFDVFWNGTSTSHTSDPGVGILAPGFVSASPSMSWSITNTARSGNILLDVAELGYFFEDSLGDGLTIPDVKTVQITRDGSLEAENIAIYVRGQEDGNCEDLLGLVARDAELIETGAPEDGPPLQPAPAAFQLLPGFPNPFNPTTTLRFDLPKAATVNLAVYDLRGRLVKSFAQGTPYDAGRHQLQWHGTDDAGRTVASGVYLLRMTTEGGQQQTQRLTLLK